MWIVVFITQTLNLSEKSLSILLPALFRLHKLVLRSWIRPVFNLLMNVFLPHSVCCLIVCCFQT